MDKMAQIETLIDKAASAAKSEDALTKRMVTLHGEPPHA